MSKHTASDFSQPESLHDMLRRHGIDPTQIRAKALCPIAWVPIWDRLIVDLIAMGWDRDIRQIKRKFTWACFYVGKATPEMKARIAEAERECSEMGS